MICFNIIYISAIIMSSKKNNFEANLFVHLRTHLCHRLQIWW